MALNPRYIQMLAKMKAMHDKKNEDYASAGDPYSNFKIAGAIGAMFADPVDIAFAVLIGVKLARLGELRGKGKVPNNESVADSHLDLAVYASLWASYYETVEGEKAENIEIRKDLAAGVGVFYDWRDVEARAGTKLREPSRGGSGSSRGSQGR